MIGDQSDFEVLVAQSKDGPEKKIKGNPDESPKEDESGNVLLVNALRAYCLNCERTLALADMIHVLWP